MVIVINMTVLQKIHPNLKIIITMLIVYRFKLVIYCINQQVSCLPTCARSPSYLYSQLKSMFSNLRNTSLTPLVGCASIGFRGIPEKQNNATSYSYSIGFPHKQKICLYHSLHPQPLFKKVSFIDILWETWLEFTEIWKWPMTQR